MGLVLSRRKGQSIRIGDDIEIVVTEVHRSSVKLMVRAPLGTNIVRGENYGKPLAVKTTAAGTPAEPLEGMDED